MKRSTWILGIHDGHDAAAALLHEGRVVAAVSEERIQRVKSAAGYPAGAIAACLAQAGIGAADIGHVALAGTRAVPVNLLGTLSTFEIRDHYRIQEELRRPKFYEGRSVPFAQLFPNYRPKGSVGYPRERIPLKESQELGAAEKAALAEFRLGYIAEKLGIARERIAVLDHHRCHAFYARFAAPFRGQKVAALTMDAGGDGVYDSVNLFDTRGRHTRLHASHDCLIGPMYTYITLLLGMRPFEHEYKVMGLAPYAKEHVKRAAREILRGYLKLEGYVFKRNSAMKDVFWHSKEALKHERFDGIAGGLQDVVEELLTAWAKAVLAATGVRHLAFAGGVALNVKANRKIAALDGLEGMFVPPGAGDESLPIGAAWALMHDLDPDADLAAAIPPLVSAYLGPAVSADDTHAFAQHPFVRAHYREISGDPVDSAVRALANKDIVAICRGRMEFGPRSLGHRSLVANASDPGAVTRINEAVKGRDFWMPFAPSILAEELPRYVERLPTADLRYMTLAMNTTEAARRDLAAGLHPYDHTARVHAVEAGAAPDYHTLLSRFRAATGLGGVLNTSLNIHGKPIVMTPREIADELLTVPGVRIESLIVGDRFFTLADRG